jgi:hypothetical protein
MNDQIRWLPMSVPISAGAMMVILFSGATTKTFRDSGLAQWWGGGLTRRFIGVWNQTVGVGLSWNGRVPWGQNIEPCIALAEGGLSIAGARGDVIR